MKVNLWKPDYALDIDVIDEQHKHFFELCGDLAKMYEACSNECIERKDMILKSYELRLYAFFHFHTEETLMVKHGYTQLLGHFQEHDNYLEQLRGFVVEMAGLSQESGSLPSGNSLISPRASANGPRTGGATIS